MKFYTLGQLSQSERSDILERHKELYNGYRTMQSEVSNTQPLYVQDFANDKNGITVSNKGKVKYYTNVGINEQSMKKELCSECGGMMREGECSECGWRGDMSETDMANLNGEFDYTEEIDEQGGNADDMDVSDVKPAYNFRSDGPMGEDFDFEDMKSAWSDDEDDEEISMDDEEDDEDTLDGELEIDFDEFDPRDKSWEEIKQHTDTWDEIDEDLKESFISQKNKISEMMIRMKI